MNFLVTGSAGFIGSAIVIDLLNKNFNVIGIDNLNNYYDVDLKKSRLDLFLKHNNYKHFNFSINSHDDLDNVFSKFDINVVIHLAAQAGVRYSISNPKEYIDSNLVGFFNILDLSKKNKIKHLLYASSSSVYGSNTKLPFSENDIVDTPLSLYAATKKSNELMAHSYSSLFNLKTTGLRFFTVYGPWGRPDMALFKFTRSIINNEKIQLYNYGNHFRDFTYIDDIVDGVIKIATFNNDETANSNKSIYSIYNIGSHKPINLKKFIEIIEAKLGKKANIENLPLQDGDVEGTFADLDKISKDYYYEPKISIEEGVSNFIDWYKKYYGLN